MEWAESNIGASTIRLLVVVYQSIGMARNPVRENNFGIHITLQGLYGTSMNSSQIGLYSSGEIV